MKKPIPDIPNYPETRTIRFTTYFVGDDQWYALHVVWWKDGRVVRDNVFQLSEKEFSDLHKSITRAFLNIDRDR